MICIDFFHNKNCFADWKSFNSIQNSISNTTIKILRDGVSTRLQEHLQKTLYYEQRLPGFIKFYDDSNQKIGQKALGFRLGDTFNEIDVHSLQESDDAIWLKLKKTFGFILKESFHSDPIGNVDKDKDSKEDHHSIATWSWLHQCYP